MSECINIKDLTKDAVLIQYGEDFYQVPKMWFEYCKIEEGKTYFSPESFNEEIEMNDLAKGFSNSLFVMPKVSGKSLCHSGAFKDWGPILLNSIERSHILLNGSNKIIAECRKAFCRAADDALITERELLKVLEENKQLKLKIKDLSKKKSDSDLETENTATGKNMFRLDFYLNYF